MKAKSARFLVDEELSPKPIRLLQQLGYDVARVDTGAKYPEIISSLGRTHGSRGVWITADRAAMTDHRNTILSSGISIAFLNVHNARRATQCFMIFSFIFRRGRLTRNTNVPLYFKLALRSSEIGDEINIRKFDL